MMKTIAILTAALCAAAAFGGRLVTVYSFTAPCQPVYGIDYHGGYIYHADGTIVAIYQTTTTGFLVKTIPNPTRARDIDRTNLEFWAVVGAYSTPYIYRLTTNGSIIRIIAGPGPIGYGVTYGEGSLWYTNGSYIYRLNLEGSIMNSFKAPGADIRDICWVNSYLWLASNDLMSYIYLVTDTGSLAETFTTAFGRRPYGVTWDGSYLWYSGLDNMTSKVFKAYPSPTAVAPASLGKVKALYR